LEKFKNDDNKKDAMRSLLAEIEDKPSIKNIATLGNLIQDEKELQVIFFIFRISCN
jgi:hypothetical protein